MASPNLQDFDGGGPIFTEEINFRDIQLAEVVGKGTFGVVRRGIWRNHSVAVKLIETEQERLSFQVELRQLSRVTHPNIVKLYGATSEPVALVMEYAEGGSLYNVLHSNHEVSYTLSHAISWVLQCARGVSYLHNMKPRPLVHRDLKPPNLLLVNGGTSLKICDFGTACDIHTHMTNNKGSAAWMAPEVFEGSNYSEKCDVFSWGIILWEVLARRKPFDEYGGPPFRIMWAVHNGQRPPLLRNCPKIIENLMVSCWSKNANDRPSMAKIEEQVSLIFEFCGPHANEPIVCPDSSRISTFGGESLSSTADHSNIQTQLTAPQQIVTEPNVCLSGTNINDQMELFQNRNDSALSVPPNLSGLINLSCKNSGLISNAQLIQPKLPPRRSSEVTDSVAGTSSHVRGHKRSSSSGAQLALPSSSNLNKSRSSLAIAEGEVPRPSTSGIEANSHFRRHDTQQPVSSYPSNLPCTAEERPNLERLSSEDFNAYLMLEPKLQPLQPDPSDQESKDIFIEHRRESQKYLRMQMEVTLLIERKNELEKSNAKQNLDILDDYWQLKSENDSLLQLKDNLIIQRDSIRRRQRQREADADGGWVLLD